MSPVTSDELCPCGSTLTFAECCGPLLAGDAAPSPERLMRSRYTAFVVRDETYLFETWHPGTRPESVDTDVSTHWLGLTILDVEKGLPGDKRGYVEFDARFRDGGVEDTLHERSRFVWQGERWWYLDGVIS